jgi:glycosyltransferase involved in cell wall biosynthesis
MHILVTADTVGGVWTWASELVRGLLRCGHSVTLVSFGDIPVAPQIQWMDGLDLDYRPTAFKLEWMQDSEADLKASAEYLEAVASETRPDIIHLSQFYYGAMKSDAPRLVVAHSDVVSWWHAVHEKGPPDSAWIRWYRRIVSRGLASAHTVVAPSRWMLQQIERCYGRPERGLVVYNGRTPSLFNPHLSKEEQVLTVGRLWDSGKNASLLLQQEMPMPVVIAGSERSPERNNADFSRPAGLDQVHFEPRQNERDMQRLFARAAVYAATSRYEPFGLAPLEAALSRCAIVASDIPSFRELWEGAAIFFRNNDSESLKNALHLLSHDRDLRLKYGNLAWERAKRSFGAERMVEEYLNIYRAIARIPSLTL